MTRAREFAFRAFALTFAAPVSFLVFFALLTLFQKIKQGESFANTMAPIPAVALIAGPFGLISGIRTRRAWRGHDIPSGLRFLLNLSLATGAIESAFILTWPFLPGFGVMPAGM